jgi:hypothetical protein
MTEHDDADTYWELWHSWDMERKVRLERARRAGDWDAFWWQLERPDPPDDE